MAYLTQSLKLEKIMTVGTVVNITENRPDYLEPLTKKFTFLFTPNKKNVDFCGFTDLSMDVDSIKDFINNVYLVLF